MDYFQYQTQKHPFKSNNKRLTQEQQRLLETSFNLNNKLDADRKGQLAQQLGLPPRQIAIWYQNRRARMKSQSLEFDHKALQQRLEEALEDNTRLEKEVERLREELIRVKQVLMSLNNTPNNYSSLSTSSEDNNSKYHLEKELYACLVVDDEGQFERFNGHDFLPPSIS